MKPGKLPSSVKRTFVSYVKKTIGSTSVIVYLPPWYEYLGVSDLLRAEKLIDGEIDLRLVSFKYLKVEVNGLKEYLFSQIKKGIYAVNYPEALFNNYRGVERSLLEIVAELRRSNSIVITKDWSIFKRFMDMGFGGYQFKEFSIAKLYEAYEGMNRELLYYAEGNLGALYILDSFGLDEEILYNYILDYYGYLESGQRKILYYLSTRTFGNKITKVYGSESYVFLKRLMDRGLILRLPGRGNYLVRDPLLRIIIHRKVFGDKFYRSSGWLYLIIKMLLGLRSEYVLNTHTGRVYLDMPVRFKWLDSRMIRILTADERTYTIIYHDELSTMDLVLKKFQKDSDVYILVTPFYLSSKTLIKLRRKRIIHVGPETLTTMVKDLRFPRPI